MAWKTIKGRQYFYLSYREGRRVKSQYWGRGELAEKMAEVVKGRMEIRAVDRLAEQAQHRAERAAHNELNSDVDAVIATAQRQAAEVLESAGFHLHKRQWRRRRCPKT